MIKEKGEIIKKGSGNLSIALVYPNNYYIGMSNLGFLSAYKLFNDDSRVSCERFFIDENTKAPLRSIENKRKINDFNAIAFSISFELDSINILKAIKISGLNLKWEERNKLDPIIMVGGPISSINPLPLFPFIDLFCLGDGEELIPIIIDILCQSKNKEQALELFNEQEGFLVPKFYEKDSKKVKPLFIKKEKFQPLISSIITNHTEFANTYLIEIMRGCPQGCRFCWTGYFQLPWKYHTPDKIISAIKNQITNLNNEKIGLIAPSSSDYPDFLQLVKEINKIGFKSISFSSFKLNDVNEDLFRLIKDNKIKTITLAPETASEDLKKTINKNIHNDDLIGICENIAKNYIKNIKLYFLIGLPYERNEHLDENIELIKKIHEKINKYNCNLSLSFNFAIPKLMTPFQHMIVPEPSSMEEKVKIIKSHLDRMNRVRVSIMSPEEAYYQCILSLGDDSISKFLLMLLNAADNKLNWRKLIRKELVNFQDILFNKLHRIELINKFPVEFKIPNAYLLQEYKKAEEKKITPPCPGKSCQRCFLGDYKADAKLFCC